MGCNEMYIIFDIFGKPWIWIWMESLVLRSLAINGDAQHMYEYIYIYTIVCMLSTYMIYIYITHLFIYIDVYPVCIQCILHTVLSEIGYVLKTTLTCLFLHSMEGFALITAGSGYCWNTTGARYLHDIESFERPIDHDLFPLFVFASKPVTSI